MPKPLVFQYGDRDFAFDLHKVDRSKLYGSKELHVLDADGKSCELATLAGDGKTLIGKGGTGLGYLTSEGCWTSKSELTPIDLEGQPIDSVASSFNAPVKLFDSVSADEYLQHNIRLVYQLTCDGLDDELEAELKRGTIFAFEYSYRGGLEADAGFLLMNAQSELFLAVGNRCKVEFIGLQQAASIIEQDADESKDLDPMDFDMI